MSQLTRSIQRELDCFYRLVLHKDFEVRHITKGAFSQARAKLKHTAFIELDDQVKKTFYGEFPFKTWNSHRILAIDGSTITLPRSKELKEHFGAHEFGIDRQDRVLARISHLYDPLNQVIVDGQIDRYNVSEVHLAHRHLDKIQPNDLILADRYYGSKPLFMLLSNKGAEFCFRLKVNCWNVAKELAESREEKESLVRFCIKDNEAKEYQLPFTELTCRLIRIELASGEIEILCTSLLDKNKYPWEQFKSLYHQRWSIEESYKVFKHRLEIENFTGKTKLAVLQDFYIKIFLNNLQSTLVHAQQSSIEDDSTNRKYQNKINRSYLITAFKELPFRLFLQSTYKRALDAFLLLVRSTTEIIRPDRKFKRRPNPRTKFSMNYKRP